MHQMFSLFHCLPCWLNKKKQIKRKKLFTRTASHLSLYHFKGTFEAAIFKMTMFASLVRSDWRDVLWGMLYGEKTEGTTVKAHRSYQVICVCAHYLKNK